MTEGMPVAPQPLSPQDERLWSMLAHLSVLLNLMTAVLGPVGALLIYLVFKDRSRAVAFHAMQSLLMQLTLWIGGGLLTGAAWAVTGLLSAVLVGLLCLPVACLVSLLPLAALGYGIYGAVEASQGKAFRYYLFADWADRILA